MAILVQGKMRNASKEGFGGAQPAGAGDALKRLTTHGFDETLNDSPSVSEGVGGHKR
jgi:hypothetical protein